MLTGPRQTGKEGKEIDFLLSKDGLVTHLIEVKTKDDKPSPSFKHYEKFIQNAEQVQLVKNLKRNKSYPNGLKVTALIPWLADLDNQV